MWAGASRTIGIAAKILFADIDPPAAFTTRGDVKSPVPATSSARTTRHRHWGPYCTGRSRSATRPACSSTTTMGVDQSRRSSGVGGSIQRATRPSRRSSTLVDSTFTTFGDMDWAELTAFAQLDGRTSPASGNTINNTVRPVLTAAGTATWGCSTTGATRCSDEPVRRLLPSDLPRGLSLDIQSNGYGRGSCSSKATSRVQGWLHLPGHHHHPGGVHDR